MGRQTDLCARVAGRRLGSRDVPAKVKLEVDWQPERYQLSQGLASLLGMELETRARVIEARCTAAKLTDEPLRAYAACS